MTPYEDDPSFPLWREPKAGSIAPALATQLALGHSSFEAKPKPDRTWVVTEHRLIEGRKPEVREHECASHGEAQRVCRKLIDAGLRGFGEAI